jgi:quercetin dioxygenase-like cupin family protein
MADPATPLSIAQRTTVADPALALPFDWGSIQWLVSDRQMADSRLTFGVVQINAGVRNPTHYHPNCDEVLFVLEGTLDHSLGAEMIRLTPGMAIHIPTGVPHHAVNVGATPARVVVAYSSGDRQTVMCETGQE